MMGRKKKCDKCNKICDTIEMIPYTLKDTTAWYCADCCKKIIGWG